jgi:hypothetical protein
MLTAWETSTCETTDAKITEWNLVRTPVAERGLDIARTIVLEVARSTQRLAFPAKLSRSDFERLVREVMQEMREHRRARNCGSNIAFHLFQQIMSALYGPVARYQHM